MRQRAALTKAASWDGKTAAAPLAGTVAGPPDAGGGGVTGGPDRRDDTPNGSKDESFFEAKPWLDSDSDDDFHSVRGDFTPSRGCTPDHYKQTPLSWRVPLDNRPKPPLVEKKHRLFELLQEKQHYDDEDDSATDISSDMENSSVHAEEHMRPACKGGKAKKSSKSSCFPNLIWKHSFTMCRNMKKEKKPK